MNGNKIHLGKTSDSRTRGKAKPRETGTGLPEKFTAYAGFYDYLLAKGYSHRSALGYIMETGLFTAWREKENIPVETTGYGDVLHYLQGLKERVQQITAARYLNSLKHYFRYLKETGEIEENPVNQVQVRGIKRKKLYDILTKPELESLYHHFEIPLQDSEHKNHNRYKASILSARRNKVILGFMAYQGLTTTELKNIDEKDVKLREGTIYIKGTRRSNERVMKLEALQIMDVMEYMLKTRVEILQLSGKESEKLFISGGTGVKLQNTIQKLIEKLHRQNSKVTSIKQIRASVIICWLKLYNLRQVQYMAGHRFVSSTESYLINDLDDLQEDINKYHPIG